MDLASTSGPGDGRRPGRARDTMRVASLILVIAVVSALHYLTPPDRFILHAVYQRSYYVPIILAAYWYGVAGGLAAAVASAFAYMPHIHGVWAHNPAYTASQYAEFIVFLLLGLSVGAITTRERRLAARYRDAAAAAERANRDLRDSQEHLRRAERLTALGEIAAGLAHEIRNPLAGVKGAVEIIASRVAAGSPEAEFAAIASRELARLESLVGEFLAYARPRPPELRQISVSDVLEHVATLLRPEADRADVTMAVLAGEVPPVLADPQQIEQVVFNVALNAVQASSRGQRVELRERWQGDRAVIEVIDQGPGIPPEYRVRIFEPFFTTKERGTGLGLAISQRIVTAHGGSMDIRASPVGGTIVRIDLPLVQGEAIAKPVEAGPKR